MTAGWRPPGSVPRRHSRRRPAHRVKTRRKESRRSTHECVRHIDRRDFHRGAATTSSRPRLLSLTSDNRLVVCLVGLAVWILLSSLDDLFIALVAIFPEGRRRCRWPTDAEAVRVPERRIAILVPLWEEHRVIGRMLERNLAAIQYANYDFFAGAYRNDTLTCAAVAEAARRSSRVHLALVPHSGPTSKGDCLNAIFDCLLEYEAANGVRFEVIVIHDAEDMVAPESDRKSRRLNSSHLGISYAVFCLKKKK